MGNYSWLVATRNHPEQCDIDWDSMNTDLLYRSWLLQDCHQMSKGERPKSLINMGQRWHDTKFIGYLDEDYIVALQEFCLHLKPCGSHPRLYYEYEGYNMLVYLEFIPGTKTIHMGQYNYHNEMKQGPQYPKEVEECESYTDEIMEIEEIYNDKLREFTKALQKTLPEREGWKVQKLVYKPTSDAEALMHLYHLIHPS